MPTTVISVISTTNNAHGRGLTVYTTIAAWEAACPVDLTVVDQIWRGECYNDGEFSAGVSFSGTTTDATRYCELTAATGESFQDQANVRNNALTYNQTNGVGIRATGSWLYAVFGTNQDTRCSRMQIKTTGTTGRPVAGQRFVLRDCLLDHNCQLTDCGLTASQVYNCVIIQRNSAYNAWNSGSSVSSIEGCTFIKPSDVTPGGIGISSGYGGPIMKSCAIFGFTTVTSGLFDAASGYNATNLASGLPGSSNQYNVTYNSTTPFVNAAAATLDARAVASTSLAANGYKDSTNAPNDISKTVRAATPTIGCWELAAAAAFQAAWFNGNILIGGF